MFGTLPVSSSRCYSVAFHPSNEPVLAVSTAANVVALYDVEKQSLAEWSRQNGARWPEKVCRLKDRISSVAFHPGEPSLLYAHGTETFIIINTGKNFPKDEAALLYDEKLDRKAPKKAAEMQKESGTDVELDDAASGDTDAAELLLQRGRRREAAAADDDDDTAKASAVGKGAAASDAPSRSACIRVFRRFGPLLHIGFIGPSEMVAVERSWMDVLEKLPDVLPRRVYGT